MQVMFQQHRRKPAVRTRDRSQMDACMAHMRGINDRGILTAKGIAVHKPAALENLHQTLFFLPGRCAEVSGRCAVAASAVALCNHSHIFGPLQTALCFERGNPRLFKRIQVVAGTHIPR